MEPMPAAVWKIPLVVSDEVVARYAQSLSTDEQLRAQRLRIFSARKRFVVTRGVLRILLARELGLTDKDIQFTYSVHGKPAVIGDDHDHLRFSVSHSANWALIALTRGAEIGVDLESISPLKNPDRFARTALSDDERSEYFCLDLALRQAFLYRCWVCKEAYAKSTGTGKILDAAEWHVDFADDSQTFAIRTGVESPTSQWAGCCFEPEVNYVAALVTSCPEKVGLNYAVVAFDHAEQQWPE